MVKVFALVAVVLLLWAVFVITLKEMYCLIRYRREYMACANFVMNNAQDLDAMFSLNRRHDHYVVKYNFIMKANSGVLTACGYKYYISQRRKERKW